MAPIRTRRKTSGGGAGTSGEDRQFANPLTAVSKPDIDAFASNNQILGECMKRLSLFDGLKSISMPTADGGRIRVERSGMGHMIHYDVGPGAG